MSFPVPSCDPRTPPGLGPVARLWPAFLANHVLSLAKIGLQGSISVVCAPLPLLSNFHGHWDFRADPCGLRHRCAPRAVPMHHTAPRSSPPNTPTSDSVRATLRVGLPPDESLVEEWIFPLDLNDIYFLLGTMRSPRGFLNREGGKGGDYLKTLLSLSDTLVQMCRRSAICSMMTQQVYTRHRTVSRTAAATAGIGW